jgi:hypothetical protein
MEAIGFDLALYKATTLYTERVIPLYISAMFTLLNSAASLKAAELIISCAKFAI